MEPLGELLAPVIMALLTAAAGWLVTQLPGPLRSWLASATHQRDIELLLGAMARRAMATAADRPGLSPTPADVVAYARTHLPETLSKLNPDEGALLTMAMAALRQANRPAPGAKP